MVLRLSIIDICTSSSEIRTTPHVVHFYFGRKYDNDRKR